MIAYDETIIRSTFQRSTPRVHHYALLISIAGLVFFLNLGVPPLWDRDEPRNAGCALEMLARGDWVVPFFNGELRAHKPVLLSWLIMSSYVVLGVGEFAARFWSAVFGIGTVLLTYEMGRRLFDPRVACWSGIVLATTVLFGVAARAATPDSVLIFWGTLALAIFVLGTFPQDGAPHARAVPRTHLSVIAMYGAMGMAVLAKGPIGVVLPMAVIGMYLLIVTLPPAEASTGWQRFFRPFRPFAPGHFWRVFWSMRPVTGLMSVLSVALPWYVWVSLRTEGAWTRGFLLEHNLGRALQPMEGHSGPAILFYVAAILVGFFPWSVLTVATALRVTVATRQREFPRQRQAMIFLLGWVGVYVGLFSLAQTKLPSYVTPSYPALALLVGYFISRWSVAGALAQVDVVWIRIGLASLLLAGGGLGFGLAIAARHVTPGSEWLGLVGCVPIVGSLVCWRWLSRGQHGKAVWSMAATAVAFCVLLMGLLPVEVGKHQRYGELLEVTRLHPGPTVAFGHLEPSWVFYGGRSIQFFPEQDVDALMQFLSRHRDTSVITTRQQLRQLPDDVAGEFDVIASTQYFLRNRQLVLARHRPLAAAASAFSADREIPR